MDLLGVDKIKSCPFMDNAPVTNCSTPPKVYDTVQNALRIKIYFSVLGVFKRTSISNSDVCLS